MTKLDRKLKYKKATDLLNRAGKLLDKAYIAHLAKTSEKAA